MDDNAKKKILFNSNAQQLNINTIITENNNKNVTNLSTLNL